MVRNERRARGKWMIWRARGRYGVDDAVEGLVMFR